MRGPVHVAAQGRMEGRRAIRSDRCGNFVAALGIFRPPASHREGDQEKRLVFLLFFTPSLQPQQKCREKRILIAASLTIGGLMREERRVTGGIRMGVSLAHDRPGVQGNCARLQGAL